MNIFSQPHPHKKSAFTLIELLVVISIIGVLAALTVPAVTGALDNARKAAVQNDIAQIASAIIAYDSEYGKLPPASSNVSGDLLDTLRGINTNGNPRKIVFLEAPDYKKNKGGVVADDNVFVDAWSNAIAVALDDDYDNTVKASTNGEEEGDVEVRKRVAIWNVTTNKRQQVRSW